MMRQNALTLTGDRILSMLISDVVIMPPSFVPSEVSANVKIKGIWDTGATNSVINSVVVQKLGLKPIGVAKIYHANGSVMANVYLVKIILPSDVSINGVRVTEGAINGADMLIGMDIINTGDFSVTNYGGRTVMSFRTPSCCPIDYVRDINHAKLPRADRRRISREQAKIIAMK